MAVFAIADLHLSFGVPNKKMDIFGPNWINHEERLKRNWLALIKPDDLVLIAGDISWAKHMPDAIPDLQWIEELPGTKVILRGNHDYWWSSLSKLQEFLPPSIHPIHNNAFNWKNISIGGARLWDNPDPSFAFDPFIETLAPAIEGLLNLETQPLTPENLKIYHREVNRIELSLKSLDPKAPIKIVMTHYPPINPNLDPSDISTLLEKYQVNICVFGHLHSVKDGALPFGTKNGIRYYLTSCDYLNCVPLKILD